MENLVRSRNTRGRGWFAAAAVGALILLVLVLAAIGLQALRLG